MIVEGMGLVNSALRRGAPGPYALQAAIASLHARAETFAATDWAQIVRLYDRLIEEHASPVIELNRAVAVAMDRGHDAGLELLDGIVADGRLDHFHLLHATRAELLRRAGRWVEAGTSYERALAQKQTEPERRYLEKRLAELRAQ